MFRLKALGGLVLESDSANIPASARQRRRLTLLVVLARVGDRGITRDRLLALLWPESTDESARHALDQLLYATRRDLGKHVISSEGGQLRLNLEAVWSDALQFEAHLQRGEWEAAAGLYAGPFLDGAHLGDSLALERWADAERAHLEECFVEALEHLARDAAERGDAQAAVAWWRRRVAAEPLSERGALGLMQALVDAGDRAGAMRYAHTYCALLREELDTEPDAEFLALTERLTREPEPKPHALTSGSTNAVPSAEEGSTSRAADERSTAWSGPEPDTSAAGAASHVRRPWFARQARQMVLMGGLVLIAGVSGVIVLGNTHTPAAQPARVRTPDPAAHALYLRGRIEWNHRSREGLERAIVLFRQAGERDPAYAEAYAGLADAYVMLGYHGYVPGEAAFPKGKAAAVRALELEPRMGEAQAALGVALQWEKRWTEAEQAFRRAIEYAPEYATAHQWYALLLTILGRREEAITHARHAAELDPLSIQIQNTYGITFYHGGMLDSALHVYERMVASEPDTAWVRQNPWVLSNFGKVAAAAGRHEDALRLIQRATREVPRHPRPLYDLAVAYLLVRDRARARATFERADPMHPHYAVYRGLLHAWLGDLDAAFDWLNRVEEWGPVMVLTLSGNPMLDALHADPRYSLLGRRLGLPEQGHSSMMASPR